LVNQKEVLSTVEPDRTSGAVLFWRPLLVLSEAFAIAERNRNPITKRVEEVVFPLVVLVSHSEALDLVDQMVF
jgi:hypothetical protein